MSEEENLPSAEEMRARYADLMKDEAPAEDASAVDRPQSAEPEPDAVEATPEPEPIAEIDDVPDPADDLAAHLLDVNVRLWAELGRSRLPLAQTVALGAGAIVDLDKEPDDELDVFVNGMPFAKGKLLLIDGEWAVRLERIVATQEAVEQASSSGSGA
jgi:flagellar motor switch protein FliN